MKKTLLVIAASLAMAASALCQVGSLFEANGINFKITSDATVEITSKFPRYAGSVIVPDTPK